MLALNFVILYKINNGPLLDYFPLLPGSLELDKLRVSPDKLAANEHPEVVSRVARSANGVAS